MTPEFLYSALIIFVASYAMYKIGWKSGFHEGIGGTLLMLSKDEIVKLIIDTDGKITHIIPNNFKSNNAIMAVSSIEKTK